MGLWLCLKSHGTFRSCHREKISTLDFNNGNSLNRSGFTVSILIRKTFVMNSLCRTWLSKLLFSIMSAHRFVISKALRDSFRVFFKPRMTQSIFDCASVVGV